LATIPQDTNKAPDVTIGLPVYNGESYLRQALDSLLAQDYPDFKLIISDNASTDSTSAICQEYAAKDRRIEYHRNERNIGALENFKQVFRMSDSKYFMWAAHDDLWRPSYIRKCVEALEQNPDAVLAYSDILFIDENGEPLDMPYSFGAGGCGLAGRVAAMAASKGRHIGWYEIYGVIRSDALRQTSLPRNVFGPDVVLMMELCLLGSFLRVPERLFLYRMVRKTPKEQLDQLAPENADKPLSLPYSGLCGNLLNVIWASKLSFLTKFSLHGVFIGALCLRNPRWVKKIQLEKTSLLAESLKMGNIKGGAKNLLLILVCTLARLSGKTWLALESGGRYVNRFFTGGKNRPQRMSTGY